MQVFGLPGQVIRNGRVASRLVDAKTPAVEAARRRDAVERWRRAIADGLTAEAAARAVGVPRSTLYRWEKAPQPQSRRPHALRKPQWTRELAQAVAGARADNPMRRQAQDRRPHPPGRLPDLRLDRRTHRPLARRLTTQMLGNGQKEFERGQKYLVGAYQGPSR